MSLLETPLTRQLGIEVPLICGAMYPCSNPELVAAVSEAGGIGVIQPLSLVYVHRHEFRAGLKLMRGITSRPLGMNVIVERSSKVYEERMRRFVDEAIEGGIRFFVTSLGNPRWVVEKAHAAGGFVYHDVTERKWAAKGLEAGVDGLIAVNDRAGGHAGPKSAEALIAELGDLGVPVVCAGGIGDEADFVRALRMGYAGVQMGTRFIATTECTAHADYKRAILEAGRGRHRADRADHGSAGGGDPHPLHREERHQGRSARPLDAARPQDEALDADDLRPAVDLEAEALRDELLLPGLFAGGEERGRNRGGGAGGGDRAALPESRGGLHVPESPKLSPNLQDCPLISRIVPEYPKLSPNLQNCPRISQIVPEFPGLSPNIPNCPRISRIVPEYPKKGWDLVGRTVWVFRADSGFSPKDWDVVGGQDRVRRGKEGPEPAMSVNEQPHDRPSNSSRRSSGRGASKSSATHPLPTSMPRGRGARRPDFSRPARTMISAGPAGRSAGRSISTR